MITKITHYLTRRWRTLKSIEALEARLEGEFFRQRRLNDILENQQQQNRINGDLVQQIANAVQRFCDDGRYTRNNIAVTFMRKHQLRVIGPNIPDKVAHRARVAFKTDIPWFSIVNDASTTAY